MFEEIRTAIIKETLRLSPLAYSSLINLLEGLKERQIILLQFLELHKDSFYPRSGLHEELKCTTVKERRKISNELRVLQRKGYVEIQVNHYAKDKITEKGTKCLSRVMDNIKIFLTNLGTEILNSIEKKQDKKHLIDLSTKLIKKLQRDPDFLRSAITRAREEIKRSLWVKPKGIEHLDKVE